MHPTFIEKFPWANLPPVIAPHPTERGQQVRLQVSREFIVGNLRKNNRTPIYQAWAHLAGCVPPVPNIAFLHKLGVAPSLSTLENAHACFRGVERPLGNDLNGTTVYIYLLKVGVTIRFDNAPPVSVPAVHRLDDDLVFAIYVQEVAGLHVAGESLWGTALKIELIETEPPDHALPIDHCDRYDERLW
jgi:hypothetical protein